MMKRILVFVIGLAVGALASEKTEFYTPSFSCDNVKAGSVEYRICTDENLSKLDVELSKVYTDVRKTLPDVLQKTYKTGQRFWVKERNVCKNQECLQNVYQNRITYLTKLLPKNNAFSPYLMFELINLFECDDKSCSEPIEKEIYEALMSRKEIKILDPIAWGNSLEEGDFEKYLGDFSENEKNGMRYVGLKQDERFRSIDTFNYSSDSIKESMKKDEALQAMCNFKLYDIDFTYYNDSNNEKEDRTAYVIFADANLNYKNIAKKEKAEAYGSVINIIDPRLKRRVNIHQWRREATTNCYEATGTVSGVFLYKDIYYYFESQYFPSINKYFDIVIASIQKDKSIFNTFMRLNLKGQKEGSGI